MRRATIKRYAKEINGVTKEISELEFDCLITHIVCLGKDYRKYMSEIKSINEFYVLHTYIIHNKKVIADL